MHAEMHLGIHTECLFYLLSLVRILRSW